jgi:hypothetical protein
MPSLTEYRPMVVHGPSLPVTTFGWQSLGPGSHIVVSAGLTRASQPGNCCCNISKKPEAGPTQGHAHMPAVRQVSRAYGSIRFEHLYAPARMFGFQRPRSGTVWH